MHPRAAAVLPSMRIEAAVLSEGLYAVVLLVVMGSALLPVLFLHDRPSELD